MTSTGFPPEYQGEFNLLQALSAVLQGDSGRSIQLSEQALQQNPFERPFFRSLAADTLGMGYTLAGDMASASQAFGQVVEISRQNEHDKPIEIETLRKNAWSKALKAAGLDRPIIQTRHTFATMMISAGENLGWVPRMLGHSSLKMITDKYFSYIPNMTHNDGARFLEEFGRIGKKVDPNVPHDEKREIAGLATP